MSETQLDSVVPGTTGTDAETGEADDVSEYSDEAGGTDPAGEAEDAPSADGAGSMAGEAESLADEADETAKPDDEMTEPGDPVDNAREEFQRELRMLPGDWYVVHSYAGYENRVKTNLESRISSLNMEDYIFQIEVPVHQVTEIKGGKRQQVQEKVLPGYILVRMDLNDASWSAVRNTPGVTGFVGATSRPSPLTVDEVLKFLAPKVESEAPAKAAKGESTSASSQLGGPTVEVDFEVGESVTVMDGPFATLPATISEV
ncbi:MAG TPA: transcription termination/antitermination protein NusG, partial [Streptosporangiaceae bacterium]|nr:transcription termination/antitermination protein NusG [Streptosporangiaceae bacterium]